MSILNVLSLIGGLALFLFGMNLMGDALEKRAGSRLKGILSTLTASPMRGFLLGLVVTCVIQSSSATTVMVVGFVNSGVMLLSQAIYIIMGANVGTAITAWLLSTTAIQGDSLVLTLLKPSSFTPVLAAIGIVMYMFMKRAKTKDTGMILLGFAVLMFGMDTMSGAVKPLANVPEFTNLLLVFSNPILGLLVGAGLTAIIQSSSASVGILQALSLTGAVTYSTAIPIILGQNIGTCVTAMLSSLGARREAKRAAMIHLLFNIIGAAFWMIVFYAVDAFVNFGFMADIANPVGIAIVHTLFKFLCVGLLMPFSKGLQALACKLVRDDKKDEESQLLDERLLVTPPIAIERSRVVTTNMANISQAALINACTLLDTFDAKVYESVDADEDRVDRYEDKLGTYLVKLSGCNLTERDSHEVSELLHLIGDFERISDHAVNIAESAQEMHDKNIGFSEGGKAEIDVMIRAVLEIVDIAVMAFNAKDVQLARRVEPLEQVVDGLKSRIKASHIQRLRRGECTIEMGFVLSDLITNLERISDHSSNIAACIVQMAHDTLNVHSYVHDIDTAKGSTYDKLYSEYAAKYALTK